MDNAFVQSVSFRGNDCQGKVYRRPSWLMDLAAHAKLCRPLLLLLVNKGIITLVGLDLSRAQIVEAVWGPVADADMERTVKVYIRRLREKIQIDPSRPTLLLTLPGLGFKLVG